MKLLKSVISLKQVYTDNVCTKFIKYTVWNTCEYHINTYIIQEWQMAKMIKKK